MKWLREWWYKRIWWHRFSHNRCVRCGEYPPMVGATMCGRCLSILIMEGVNE